MFSIFMVLASSKILSVVFGQFPFRIILPCLSKHPLDFQLDPAFSVALADCKIQIVNLDPLKWMDSFFAWQEALEV